MCRLLSFYSFCIFLISMSSNVLSFENLNFALILNNNPQSLMYRGKLEPAIDIGIKYFNYLNGARGYNLIKHVIAYPERRNSQTNFKFPPELGDTKGIKGNKSEKNTLYPFQMEALVKERQKSVIQPYNATVVSGWDYSDGLEKQDKSMANLRVSKKSKEQPRFFQGWNGHSQDLQITYVCDPSNVVGRFADLKHRVELSFILGPPCSHDMRVISPVAAYYRLPICTGYSDFDEIDLGKHPTMTRLSFSIKGHVLVVHKLLKTYNHRDALVICDVRWDRAKELSIHLNERFKTNHYFVEFGTLYFDGADDYSFKPEVYLNKAKKSTKAIIIMSDAIKLRSLLITADRMGLGNGHFLFIAIELYPGYTLPETPWANGDKLDSIAKRAFNTLVIIGLKQPTGDRWNQFSRQVKKLALANYDFLYSGPVNYFIGAFYDCVIMYAKAFNQFNSTSNVTRDRAVVQISPDKFWNSSFVGVTGTVRLDEFGDRLADLAIYGMVNRYSGIFDIVATYKGHTQMIQFEKSIDWIMGSPPTPHLICTDFKRSSNVTYYKNCDKKGDPIPIRHNPNFKILMAVLAFVLTACIAILSVYMYRKKRDKERYMRLQMWKIDIKNLFSGSHLRSSSSLTFNSTQNVSRKYAVYKNVFVHLKYISKPQLDVLSGRLMHEISQIHKINHENLVQFVGLCQTKNDIIIVSEMVSKMTLLDLLAKEKLEIDQVLQFSIINDILKGMIYLHDSKIKFHGRLRSSHVLIDNRFSAKITSFGLTTLYEQGIRNDYIRDLEYKLTLPWIAPECLRQEQPVIVTSQSADVYSFAILLTELVTKKPPYYYNYLDYLNSESIGSIGADRIGPDESPFKIFMDKQAGSNSSYLHFLVRAMRRVKDGQRPAYRPLLGRSQTLKKFYNSTPDSPAPHKSEDMCGSVDLDKKGAVSNNSNGPNKKWKVLIEMCWDENPVTRATFSHVYDVFRGLSKNINFGNMIEILLERMEDYTKALEGMVWQKTKDLVQEKERVDQFLFQILPRPVAEDLKAGVKVEPEVFRNVTIYMSDIVKFTVISSTSTALEIVDFLNDVYCCFDSLVEKLDAYKVETIGDAYMVVSGLPKRNGNKHFREIARFALSAVKSVSQFKIRHKPDEKLKIRIGIHTGSCAAGIVGVKMPRYCLFGATVNTASKMESSGEAMRIHLSETTKAGLDDFPEFKTEERGTIEIEGRGTLKTYWLVENINTK